MIGYLEGKILKKENDRIVLLVNHVGYEVLLPSIVGETLKNKSVGDALSLYIYFQQTERQPKPVLIGFNLEAEKEFFQHFISVEAVGPLKAARAMNIPVRDIAHAIETENLSVLKQLKGIGNRTAQKIIATLKGKMEKFVLISKRDEGTAPVYIDFKNQVLRVLVDQLGHKTSDAKQMIAQALNRNRSVSTPEELFDEVYRGETAI
ncbi:MAG: Holliday junction DNA helicase RuvA [Deltaproteobacteria bacterium]|nr:Holliday junction DNA helicase RuvA [Deltaproteobacteria bacterium]NNK86148.1 Holliday junction DNA helicase RuvA [Desulfobacterales bacterium]